MKGLVRFSGNKPTLNPLFRVCLAFFSLWLFATSGHAATITVTNGNDTGSGSLRSAISTANSGDIIQFSGVTTVTLTSAELLVDKNLTINGGTPGVTITRSGATVFRIFRIAGAVTATLNNLTISNGNHATQAGGVHISGTLTMNNCVVVGNTSPQGAGVQNDGTLAMNNCIILNNTGNSGYAGCGLAIFSTTSTTLKNCVFTGNTGSFSLIGGDFSGTHTAVNTIVYGNSQSNIDAGFALTYSVTTRSGTGNLSANPLFVNSADPDGADNIWRTADDGLRISNCSPALNTGTNTGAPPTDILGNTRPYSAGIADKGAYEMPVSGCPTIKLEGGDAVNIVNNDVTPATADGTDFGPQLAGSGSVSRTFTIKSTGTASLSLTGNPKVAVSGTNAGDFTVSPQPGSPITAGSSTTFTVIFDPSATGLRTATLTISSNDGNGNETFTFAIQGTGESQIPVLMSNGSSTGCAFNFYDSGGPTFNYSNSESYVHTFNPSGSGNFVRITWNSFVSESCCDRITIYNGASTASPILYGPSSGTLSIPTLNSSTGPLTIKFTSDGSGTGAGWSAAVDCISCSGAPAAANTVLASPSACTGYPFTLGLSTTYNNLFTYQWKSSDASNGTYTDIAGATASTYTTTPGTTTTVYYKCAITCLSSGQTTLSSFLAVTPSGSTIAMNCPQNMSVCTNPVYYPTVNYTATNSACLPTTLAGFTFIGAFGGHHYFRSSGTATWANAKTAAGAAGGYLATVSSTEENDFLKAGAAAANAGHWLGLTDETTEGSFAWDNGDPVTYTNWAAGQPGNTNNEDYAEMGTAGTWNDLSATITRRYFLEMAPPNANSSFTALASLQAGLASGQNFPFGVTTVTYGVGSTTCSFTVTLTNPEPSIACPQNITTCINPVVYPTPVVSIPAPNCAPTNLSGYSFLSAYDGHHYFLSTSATDWSSAQSLAFNLGGHLAAVTSSGENDFLAAKLLAANVDAFIGLNDLAVEGTFDWDGGEALSYTNWATDEPNDGNGAEDFVVMLAAGGQWSDVGSITRRYLLEFDIPSGYEAHPEPVLISGLASGSNFPEGTSTVTYGYNGAACSFTVELTTPTPTLTCPTNVTVCANPVYYAAPTAVVPAPDCLPTSISGFTFIGVYNGHHYFRSNSTATLAAANTAATNLGAYLATIGDSLENEFLHAGIAGTALRHFIGLNDTTTEGTYVWQNGEPVTYLNWDIGQPDNFTGGNEDYIVLKPNGKWNDVTSAANRYIMEFELPTSYSIAGTPSLLSGLKSGSDFPNGVTTVTYGLNDGTCSFTVTKNNAAPAPNLTCPPNITTCTNPVFYPAPTGLGTCTGCTPPTSIPNMTYMGTLNGNTYFRSTTSVTWAVAKEMAERVGGHLVIINDVAENDFVKANMGSTTTWIGLTDEVTEGSFKWVDGNVLNYNNWTSGEPNNGGSSGNEDYAAISTAGTWGDLTSTSTARFCVEFDCLVPVSPTRTAGLASGSNFPTGTTFTTYQAGNSACTFSVTLNNPLNGAKRCPSDITVCENPVRYQIPTIDVTCTGCTLPTFLDGFTYIGTYGSHTYFRSNTPATWEVAEGIAAGYGGHLACIAGSGENTFLKNAINPTGNRHWIGLNEGANEGDYAWINGDALTYTNWNTGEPNDANTGESAVELFTDGTWNDNSGSNSFYYLIEFDNKQTVPMNLATGLASGSTFPTGTSNVTYSYGNQTCAFTVTVNTPTASISCPPNITTCLNQVEYPAPVGTATCNSCSLPTNLSGFDFLGSNDGHNYFRSQKLVTWKRARELARQAGGYLLTINSATENAFIQNAISPFGLDHSIGLTDEGMEGTFVWENGDPLTYTNWGGGDPNNFFNEDYSEIGTNGTWKDNAPTNIRNFIVELDRCDVDQTPTRTAGLASGSTFPNGTTTMTYTLGSASCSFTVTISPVAAPTNATATPSAINCGEISNLTAISADNDINWYTVNTGGSPLGNSPSGLGFPVNPPGTTQFFAETIDSTNVGVAAVADTFYYTGNLQSWTVPPGITSARLDIRGAGGGSNVRIGGAGGRVQTTLTVTPGTTYQICVGGKGQNSTSRSGAGGGGFSGLLDESGNHVVTAGGGGGGNGDYKYLTTNGNGGAGGGATGGAAGANGSCGTGGAGGGNAADPAGGAGGTATYAGQPGTVTGGGAGGDSDGSSAGSGGGGGSYGTGAGPAPYGYGYGTGGGGGFGGGGGGGTPGVGSATERLSNGGGGGGGYRGGAGGNNGINCGSAGAGGGGGGADYVIAGASGTIHTQGGGAGAGSNGMVIITHSGALHACYSPTRTPVTVAVDNNTIVSQPSNASACPGTNATFAVGTTGSVTYQWQENVGSGTFNNITNGGIYSGATTATLTLTGVASGMSGNQYRCHITAGGACGIVNTVPATLTVSAPDAGTISTGQTICPGGDPTAFTETNAANGPGMPIYSWEISTTNCSTGFNPIPDATAITYDPPAGLNQTSYYRRIVTFAQNGNSCSAISNCVTVTPADNIPPSITCPANTTVGATGGTYTMTDFTASASATDNCTANPVKSQSPGIATSIPVGSQTVSLTATDATGNTGTCSFTLIVEADCPPTSTIWYVDGTAASGGTGSSWACAFQNVQDALDAASSGHEIWVKAGTYLPTKDPFGNAAPADPRDKTLYLKNGVALYGGFAGTETMRAHRNWTTNVTILSGDIGTPDVNTDNAYHVVLSVSDASTTVLDGFTVEKGNADVGTENTVEAQNVARNFGGGLHNAWSSMSATNCIFSGNAAGFAAGNYNRLGAPTFTSCSFSGNGATGIGGGMYNHFSAASLTNCTISGNNATTQGGGVYSTTSDNTTLKNCVVWNNRSSGITGSGNANLFNDNSTPVITYSLIQNHNPAGTGNLNGIPNAGLSNYPDFVTPLDPATAPSTAGDFHLGACSPVLEKGTNTGAPATDLFGNARPFGSTVDMGVHERQSVPTPAMAVCQNITVQLDGAGNGTLTAYGLNNGSTGCVPLSFSASQTNFNCTNLGANTVTLTVTGLNGSTATCNATVTVADNVAPNALCRDFVKNLGSNGTATITPAEVNNLSNDNCGTVNLVGVSPAAFTCANLGANTVTLTVNDGHSNTATCNATVTVADNSAPTAVCQNISVNLNSGGSASVTAAQVNNSSTDNCGTTNLSLSTTNFTCANVGANAVVLTVNDGHGNSATCTATVTVSDNINPTATCQNVSVNLNSAGSASVTAAQINNGSTDNCGIAGLSLSTTSFTCANVGANTVTLTVTDNNGRTATCTATVTVSDNTPPTAVCQNATVNLDQNGNATLAATQVDGGSTDNCGIASQAVVPNTFGVANIGANTVTLTVTANNGQAATCTATITVTNSNQPNAVCQPYTAILNAGGTAAITAANVDGGSSAVGGIQSMSVSPNSFNCNNLGNNTVTLTVTGNNGSTATCNAVVTVQDITAPTAVCQTVSVNLSGNSVTITATQVLNAASSTDNCGTVNAQSVSPSSFTCANLGANTVTLTANDGHGNTSTCTATVTVSDNTNPTAVCQNISVNLNAGGTANIGAVQVNNGSTDNCSTVNLVGVSPSAFTCAHIGANTVTLTVNDGHGNTATCTATVAVSDNSVPTALCRDIVVQLDANGNVAITAAQINNGSFDNCALGTQTVAPNSFTLAHVGINTVMLTVSDVNSNTTTCSAQVTIENNQLPNAVCRNIARSLDANGQVNIAPDDIDDGSTALGGIANRSVSPAMLTCANIGAATVTLSVLGNNGQQASCNATVTVSDNLAPTAVCQNIPVNLNSGGTASVTAAQVNNGSTDNCGTVNLVGVSPSSFTCANLGPNTVTLTVNDGHGNSATCTATVTVSDNTPLTAVCQNATVNLDQNGNATLAATQVDGGSTDNCGIASQAVVPNTFGVANIGANTVTLTVTANNGQTATCTATITVTNSNQPNAVCQPYTAILNAGGTAAITAANVDGGSSAVGGIQSMSVSPNSFNCNNLGNNTVTLTVTGNNGSTATCNAAVTVQDITAPTAVCQNIPVNLNSGGTASVTAAQVNNGSTDNCGTVNLVGVSPSSFACANLGPNTVTLTVNDGHGNSATCTATVTVSDNLVPTAICQNVSVNLNNGGTASVTAAQVNNNSTDNCGTVTLDGVSPNSFGCANLGANAVILTVSDENSNSATCSAIVTVNDNMAPTAVCQNVSVNLNAGGTASVTAAQVNNNSTDNCGTVTLDGVSPSSFGCANLGANTVTLTVNDGNGNSAICSAIVTVNDPNNFCCEAPQAFCQPTSVMLDGNGQASILVSAVNNGSTYDCGMQSMSVSPATATCANIGALTVMLTVTDAGGQTSTCTTTVFVSDNLAPTAVCQNVSVNLNAGGTASVTAAQVNNNSTDNCGTITLDGVSPNSFGCANLGANAVILTVSDENNNSATCSAIVTVSDNLAPTAVCQNVSVNLNAGGTASVTAAQVNNNSTDNCGTVTLDGVSPSSFGCANLGVNTVILTVSDENGNSATCSAIVTVNDPNNFCCEAPQAFCQPTSVMLDGNGQASILVSAVNNGSTYDCGFQSMSVSPATATCANIGALTVMLTVTDVGGQTSTCTTTVSVSDNLAPTAVCQNVSVNLNAGGMASVTAAQVNNNSTDNCGTVTLDGVSPNSFGCANLGANTVIMTVSDENSNSATCSAIVTVNDNLDPTAICQNVSVNLNSGGSAFVTAAQVNNNSTDNCGTVTLDGVSPSSFGCANLGANTVTLTVSDENGNTAMCSAIVTVNDPNNFCCEAPQAFCQPTSVMLDGNGQASILVSAVNNGSTYDCGFQSMSVSPATATCANIGALTVMLTVTDAGGQTSTCTTTVSVSDNLAPTAVCQNVSVNLNAGGTASVTATQVNNNSTDNCGTVTLDGVSPNSFGCANLGANAVILTVSDENNNSATCSAIVTVSDNLAPTAVCQNVSVNLNAGGTASVTAAQVNNNSTDNCGTVALDGVSPNSFGCANLGPNTVTLTVNDGHGNSATCTATVTVSDNLAPTAICQNVSVNLNNGGTASVTATQVNNNSTDNCGTVTLDGVSPNSFGCANLGTNAVILTVSDENSNSATCSAIVTVNDNMAPTARCLNTTAVIQSNEQATISVGQVNNGSTDNCEIQNLALSQSTFDCAHIGVTTVTLTVTDLNGLTSTCTANVTVIDPNGYCCDGPDARCKPATISLNASGQGVIQVANVNNGSTYECGLLSISINQTAVSCSNVGTPLVITLTVTDINNVTDNCTAIVTVVDNQLPAITCPAATLVTCAGAIPAVNLNTVTASDNCSPVTKSHLNDSAPYAQTCDNRFKINRIYQATDPSNNTKTCVQVITVSDYTKPVFSNVPANVTVQCNNIPALGTPTASDGCGGTVTIAYNGETRTNGSCTDTYSLTRKWTASDACGNTKTATQKITVQDTQKPVFTAVPQNLTIQCSDPVPLPGNATATDNCDADVAVVYLGQNSGNAGCQNSYQLFRTWKATDNCGNSTVVTQTIVVQDTQAPTFTSVPGNVTIQCSDLVPPIGTPTATDACNGYVQIVFQGQYSTAGNCPGNYTITRTWRAQDLCGNSTTASQVITLHDTQAPVFTNPPANVTIACGGTLPTLPAVTAADNCDNTLPVTYLGETNTGPDCPYTVTRSWTVSDDCGNSRVHTQVITVGNEFEVQSLKFEEHRSRLELHPGNSGSNSELQTPNFKLQTPNFELQTSNFELQTSKFELQTSNFELYPNPAISEAWVAFHAESENEATVFVFDAGGRLVQQQVFGALAGSNRYRLDLFDLPAGMYSVRMVCGEQVGIKKLMVVRQ